MSEYLFDEEVVQNIKYDCDFMNHQFPEVGEHLILRPLSSDDFEKGFTNVLAELTEVGCVDKKLFINRFNFMKSCPDSYFIIVVEDTEKQVIVASATLVVEQKFIHGCSSRGRIEDVVVSKNYRSKDLGKILVTTLLKLSEKLKCYKVSLECKDGLVPFYQNLGLQKEDGQVTILIYRIWFSLSNNLQK